MKLRVKIQNQGKPLTGVRIYRTSKVGTGMRRAPLQRENLLVSFDGAAFREFDVVKTDGSDAWLRSVASSDRPWGKLMPLGVDRMACVRASDLTLQLVVLAANGTLDENSGYKISLECA